MQYSREQLIAELRSRNPAFAAYSDDEVIAAVEKEWPSLIRHIAPTPPPTGASGGWNEPAPPSALTHLSAARLSAPLVSPPSSVVAPSVAHAAGPQTGRLSEVGMGEILRGVPAAAKANLSETVKGSLLYKLATGREKFERIAATPSPAPAAAQKRSAASLPQNLAAIQLEETPAPPQSPARGLEDLGAVRVARARSGLEDLGAVRVPSSPNGEEASPSFVGGMKNLATSTGRLLGNVGDMVLHPIDTLSGINELGWGVVEKAAPGARERVTGEPMGDTNPVDLVLDNLKERYGSWAGVKKTAYNDPAGMMADIAAIMSGAGGGLKVAGKLGSMAKVARVGEIVSEGSRFVDPLNLTAKAVTSVGAPIARGAGKLASEAVGLTTGAGGEAVRTAYRSPSIAFKEAMRGDIDITDIANNVRAAVDDVRKSRGLQYRTQLASLPVMDLDAAPIFKSVNDNLADFGVQLAFDPHTGQVIPDFNGPMNKIGSASAKKEISEVVRQVFDQPGKSNAPLAAIPSDHLDALKQRLDSLYHESSEARKLTASVKSTVRNQLSLVPGYDAMAADYERASRFLDDVKSELSAKSTTAKGTMVRKLAYALNQNNEYRQLLIEALDSKTGAQLKDQIAGYALSKWAPRGLMRTVAGARILYGMAQSMNPVHLVTVLGETALASPRAMGEVISGAGDLAKSGSMMRRVTRTAGAPAVYRPLMGAARPSTIQPKPPPE